MLQRLIEEIKHCLAQLDAKNVSGVDLERWAVLIFESMSASSRTYHRVKHVFDITEGISDPIPILAGFFHDVVYYACDGGLSIEQEEILRGIIEEEKGGVVRLREKIIVPHYQRCLDTKEEQPEDQEDADAKKDDDDDYEDEEDTLILSIASIFNMKPGQVLNPFLGLNEFLSAACAVRCFRDHLPIQTLAKIATCIEITIPFRKPDAHGNTPPDLLYQNLLRTNEKFSLDMTTDEISSAVHHAVDLANRDLESFSTTHHATFLSNTWNLMHETNIDLRHTTVYRISSFALALKKMSMFFLCVDADSLYVSFENEPSQDIIEEMKERAKENIDVASRYVQAKFLAVSVLAALAELTGGDAPLALFAGGRASSSSEHLEDYICPSLVEEKDLDKNISINMKVYDLLLNGRDGGVTNFDIQNSPLAAYLYGILGDVGLDQCLSHAVYPMDKKHARLLLDSMPKESVVYIAKPCAIIAKSREDMLTEIVKEYSD